MAKKHKKTSSSYNNLLFNKKSYEKSNHLETYQFALFGQFLFAALFIFIIFYFFFLFGVFPFIHSHTHTHIYNPVNSQSTWNILLRERWMVWGVFLWKSFGFNSLHSKERNSVPEKLEVVVLLFSLSEQTFQWLLF